MVNVNVMVVFFYYIFVIYLFFLINNLIGCMINKENSRGRKYKLI